MSAAQTPSSGYKLCPQCRQIYPAIAEFCPRDEVRLIVEPRILDGKYILQSRLGAGMGSEVYAAEQPHLGRMVAIKLLPADPEVLRDFDRGVRVIGSVKHEHVVTIYDSGRSEDGRPYIVMEHLEGEDLAQRLGRSGALPAARAVALWRQAVSAVAAAHRRNIVHGDLKPRNLFLTSRERDDGKEDLLKVIDFRVAKAPPMRPDATPRGAELMRYAAPEVLHDGEATPRSDVYSLGLVLLEMVWGRLQDPGVPGAEAELGPSVLRQLEQSLSPTRPEGSDEKACSDELLQLVATTLRRDPALRPADAAELLPLLKRLPETEPPPGPSPPATAASGGDSGEHAENHETPQMGVAVLNELLHKLKEREQPPARSHAAANLVVGLMVAASLGGLLWLGMRASSLPAAPSPALPPPVPTLAAPPPAPLPAPEPVERPDLAVVDQQVADLAPTTDAAAAADLADSRAIKVRLVYGEDDEVTAIECSPEAQVLQHVLDRRGLGIEAVIHPGGSCRATGPGGSRVYKYDSILQKHPDSSGFRRIHVRPGESGSGEAWPPARPNTEDKPPPRTDSPASSTANSPSKTPPNSP